MRILSSDTTPLHPCGLEAVTIDDSRYLLCSCYELKEEEQTREGCLQIYCINEDDLTLSPTSCIYFAAGILDFKVDRNYVNLAMSNGQLLVYHLSESAGRLIHHLVADFVRQEEGLFLSVDYNMYQGLDNEQENNTLCIATQASSIILVQQTENGFIELQRKTSTHCMLGEPMPVWTIAMDKFHDRNRFLSGGDDCILRLWDLRCESSMHHNNFHSAGVTTTQWHPKIENIFLTGSYDEQCCIWDARSLKKPLHVMQTSMTSH
jgi:diphthamide biosynthesis protein 7